MKGGVMDERKWLMLIATIIIIIVMCFMISQESRMMDLQGRVKWIQRKLNEPKEVIKEVAVEEPEERIWWKVYTK